MGVHSWPPWGLIHFFLGDLIRDMKMLPTSAKVEKQWRSQGFVVCLVPRAGDRLPSLRSLGGGEGLGGGIRGRAGEGCPAGDDV